MPPPPQGCALDAIGKLKDASEIPFYASEDDDVPMGAKPAATRPSGDEPTHEHRKRGQRLQELIDAQKLDDDGNLEKKHRPRMARPRRKPAKRTKVASLSNDVAFSSDGDDSDFSGASSDDSVVSEDEILSNGELADILLSKATSSSSRSKKRKRPKAKESTSKTNSATPAPVASLATEDNSQAKPKVCNVSRRLWYFCYADDFFRQHAIPFTSSTNP
ncbi:hypothetical protein H0H81_008222 [Sphagnurus paluster]|uniref:Uncharacterized protein n=1 Tax=Sphagnurus paluster TaxID=117069 RepID=A0A9P7K1S6_9AGAR|nr:hypothetical protein H0H81_008222 [Sphagnurus paluster]